MAGTLLLLAGCTTNSGGTSESSLSAGSSSAASGGPSAPDPSVGAPPGSSAPSDAPASIATASAATGPSVSAPAGTTAPPVSTAPPVITKPPVSSRARTSAPVSPTAAVLDAASTRWLTTYCTTIGPVTGLTALQSQISAASGDLTKIKGLFVEAFGMSGGAMTATAAALKGHPAPTLTAAGNDLPVLLSRIGTLGAELTRDETRLAAIDPVAQATALGAALTTYGPDIDRISAVVGTNGGLKLPAPARSEVGRIAACNKVLNVG